MKTSYETFLIPTPASEEHLSLYTQIRLAALSTNPEAFGSTYERESKFSRETWRDRMNTKGRTTFAAVDAGHSWIGTIAFLGPEMLANIPQEPAYPHDIAQREKNGEIDVYMIVGMWVHPEHRGKGVGRRLVDYALETIRKSETVKDGAGTRKKVVLLEVHEKNAVAKNLYRHCGFLEAGGEDRSVEEGEEEEEEEEEEIWMSFNLD
ncbi:acyl-CoA N-acyltransferase [Agrocybe pediades]|nr:acyl-CoA N-acyltransferase [Agrocybe pediades]